MPTIITNSKRINKEGDSKAHFYNKHPLSECVLTRGVLFVKTLSGQPRKL